MCSKWPLDASKTQTPLENVLEFEITNSPSNEKLGWVNEWNWLQRIWHGSPCQLADDSSVWVQCWDQFHHLLRSTHEVLVLVVVVGIGNLVVMKMHSYEQLPAPQRLQGKTKHWRRIECWAITKSQAKHSTGFDKCKIPSTTTINNNNNNNNNN